MEQPIGHRFGEAVPLPSARQSNQLRHAEGGIRLPPRLSADTKSSDNTLGWFSFGLADAVRRFHAGVGSAVWLSSGRACTHTAWLSCIMNAVADFTGQLHDYEDEHGYVLVRLTLTRTKDGGRRTPVASGYRACWDISRAGDHSLLTDAPLLIEGAEWLKPGKSAITRLHPLFREYWTDLARNRRLGKFEGSRRVGLGGCSQDRSTRTLICSST